MPNRIIKESICTSESIGCLSWFEEVLFYRIIVACDDFGRYDGRPVIIKNKLFPLREKLSARQVADGLTKLASVGLICLYEADGKQYLYIPTWLEHQSKRAKSSKFPDPPTNAGGCMQMHAEENQSEKMSPYSNSYSNSYSYSRDASASRRFTPPSVEDVRAYCQERKNTVDPQKFVDHYTSNGWKVGKNPMKDWRASVRTWEKREEPKKPAKNSPEYFGKGRPDQAVVRKCFDENRTLCDTCRHADDCIYLPGGDGCTYEKEEAV